MRKLFVLTVCSLISFTISAQHTLNLKSGEKMSGEVKSLIDGNLKFMFKGNEMNFKVAEISSINFDGNAPASSSTSNTTSTKGVSYIMAGRKMTKEPKIDNLTMEKGIVVVEITVNKYGNVIKAIPGIEGSTTTSNYLLTKAKQAAESVMFDTSPIMPQSQSGSITITF
jgi:periplasmic protein TonB